MDHIGVYDSKSRVLAYLQCADKQVEITDAENIVALIEHPKTITCTYGKGAITGRETTDCKTN